MPRSRWFEGNVAVEIERVEQGCLRSFLASHHRGGFDLRQKHRPCRPRHVPQMAGFFNRIGPKQTADVGLNMTPPASTADARNPWWAQHAPPLSPVPLPNTRSCAHRNKLQRSSAESDRIA